nr:hypothetical protein [uncultured Mediterranean phage uvMED]
MTQQFPPKPWVEGDTFVNIETGVEYAFNGEQWLSSGSQYQAGYTERGTFEYRRSGDAFGVGVLQNAEDGGSRPHDSLTRIKLHKTSKNSNTAPAGYYQPGQLLRFTKNADAAVYRITTVDADNDNFYLIDVTFAGLQGQSFSFFLSDIVVVECREIKTDSSVDYLPLTGGTVTGELRVNKPNNQPIFEITADKVELQKHATSITQLEPKEIINVGILDNLMRDTSQYGYLTGLATEQYVDDAIKNIDIPDVDLSDYLPLAGGQMTGPIISNRGAGNYAIRIETDGAHKLTIWNDGVVESTRTGFNDNHLVTKKYVDENAGGITPGDQVAKTNGTNVEVGGFYVNMGNLYVRIS